MSITSQPVPFNWQQVDERLSSIMQSKISAEIQKLTTDDIGHIRFQNMTNENSMTVPSLRLQMQLLRADEWAARLYEGYCEIWQTQRKPLSPEFLRALPKHAIGMLVSVRKSSVADEFAREQQRTRSHNTGWLQSSLQAFARDMDRLLNKWEQSSEFDARTVQYMFASAPEGPAIRRAVWEVISAQARVRTLETGIASIEARIEMAGRALNGMLMAETPTYRKASVEQSVSQLKDKRKELRSSLDDWQARLKAALGSAEELEGKRPQNRNLKGSTYRRRRAPDVAPYRAGWKRATKALLIEKPRISDLQICRELDDSASTMPQRWTVGDKWSFEDAYRDPTLRQRIHTAISKIRADLRKNRVIE